MTSPDTTLKVMREITHRYGRIAGYKINEVKLTILSMNLDESVRTEIQKFDSTPWKKRGKHHPPFD